MPASKPSQLDLVSLPALCRTITLPGDNQPVRLPTYPAIERTSVLPFNSTLTTVVPASGMRGVLTKSSTMPLWLEQAAGGVYSWSVGWTATQPGGTYAASTHSQRVNDMAATAFSGPGSFGSRATVAGTNTPPGGYPILGEFELNPYIYYPKGANLVVTVDTLSSGVPTAPSSNALLMCETVDFGGTKSSVALELVTATTYAGWIVSGSNQNSTFFLRPISIETNLSLYAANITVTVASAAPMGITAGAGTVNIGFNGALSNKLLMPAVKPPALEVSSVPFSNTRVTACSALFTNVTKILNKEGTILAGRFNPTTMDVFDADTGDYASLTPAEKYFYGLEKGFYTYLPLQTDVSEFADDVWDSPQISLTGVRIPWLHLGRTALTTCFRFDDPDGGTSLAVNVDWHVEFRNSSVLWPVAVSAMSLEEAHQAQLVALEAGLFFDNVDHRYILSQVSKGLGVVMPYIKAAMPAFGAAAASARGMIRSYLGPSGPKPTVLNTPKVTRSKPVVVAGGKKDKKRKDKQDKKKKK